LTSSQTGPEVPALERRFPWAPRHLVEGTDALLWPASAAGLDASGAPAAHTAIDPGEAWPAVLSWVRSRVVRFELLPPPRPVPEVVLASTMAVEGPVRFVARRAYQVGRTVACDPPEELLVAERRDLFRLAVAAPVTIGSPAGRWATYCVDLSLGGLRVPVPSPLAAGTEVGVTLGLGRGEAVAIGAVVRHCEGAGGIVLAGVEFQAMSPRTEQRLCYFVGSHQRRLLPRAQVGAVVDYWPEGGGRHREAPARELSPGDVAFVVREARPVGERLGLHLRLNRHDYDFGATVVSCGPALGPGDADHYLVRASLDEMSEEAQGRFRRAVREAAIERYG